jgi:hypothetical protein
MHEAKHKINPQTITHKTQQLTNKQIRENKIETQQQ